MLLNSLDNKLLRDHEWGDSWTYFECYTSYSSQSPYETEVVRNIQIILSNKEVLTYRHKYPTLQLPNNLQNKGNLQKFNQYVTNKFIELFPDRIKHGRWEEDWKDKFDALIYYGEDHEVGKIITIMWNGNITLERHGNALRFLICTIFWMYVMQKLEYYIYGPKPMDIDTE